MQETRIQSLGQEDSLAEEDLASEPGTSLVHSRAFCVAEFY